MSSGDFSEGEIMMMGSESLLESIGLPSDLSLDGFSIKDGVGAGGLDLGDIGDLSNISGLDFNKSDLIKLDMDGIGDLDSLEAGLDTQGQQVSRVVI